MLIDTSGWFCLLHGDEEFHERAHDLYRPARPRITHNYVLAELMPLARKRNFPPPTVIAFLQALADNPAAEIVWVDPALHHAGLDLLAARPDKEYSLCDAVGFVLMRRFGITEALTTDHHFEQEGFVRLLK
jgi:uncharacterized protein